MTNSVQRNTMTYHAAISACGKGEPGEGVEQHTITYNTAINTCEKSEKWQQGLCPLERMPADDRTMLVKKASNGSMS